jgi:hypothetical protein
MQKRLLAGTVFPDEAAALYVIDIMCAAQIAAYYARIIITAVIGAFRAPDERGAPAASV